jgi:hypothetical protein
MARLQGFRRERGSGRGYIGPNGERISYRQYRNLLEREGAVQRLDPVELANARRRQRAFNDIINQMAKVRSRALEHAIENAEELGDDEAAEELRSELRHVKIEAIKSPSRKEALTDLKTFAHRKDAEGMERTKLALIALGRREGIPDWVPVGGSDRFRSGKLRRDRIPQRLRPRGRGNFNTRLSKG